MYDNWIPITNTNNHIISNHNKTVDNPEYFNSVLYQQFHGMLYKYVHGELVVVKVNAIMGKFNTVQYGNTMLSDGVRTLLNESGITLRGHDIVGKIDQFGREYEYSTDDFIQMKGRTYKRIRSYINNTEFTIVNGYNSDMDFITKAWSTEHNSKHQLRMLDIIKHNLDIVKISTVYSEGMMVGFSVTEPINDNYSVAIQRLINPNVKGIVKEPNFLLHYTDCINNIGKTLNLGASRDQGQDIAKRKLIPSNKKKIYRKVSAHNLTKEHYNKLKNN